jgi:hypothetical protein
MTLENQEKNLVSVYLVKLITGELLMTEAYPDEDEITIHLVSPIRVSQDVDGARFSLAEWIVPFLASPIVDIQLNDVVLMEAVSDQYVKIYGSFLTQIMINQIKTKVAENMNSSSQYYDIMNAVDEIKKVSKEMSEKFDIPEIDLSEFEEQSRKFEPPRLH